MLALLGISAACAAPPDSPLVAYIVSGDAIERPLVDTPPDAARGRAIVFDRQLGLCLMCHPAPGADAHATGTLATSLAGAGRRWSVGQLRLRVVDARRLNPQTPMPSFYRVDGLQQVGAAWRGRPILSAAQIEDVVAYLADLRD